MNRQRTQKEARVEREIVVKCTQCYLMSAQLTTLTFSCFSAWLNRRPPVQPGMYIGLSRAVVSFHFHPLPLVSCSDRIGVCRCNNVNKTQLEVLAVFFPLPRHNSHSHALYSHSHPIPIPQLILFPFPWESHGIPVFSIPMHISNGGPLLFGSNISLFIIRMWTF